MAGFETFGTSIVFAPAFSGRMRNLGVPRVWRTDSVDDPTGQFWCDDTGLRSWHSRGPSMLTLETGLRPASQLLVRARDAQTVESVVSLVHCGALAGYPDLLKSREADAIYQLEVNGVAQEPPVQPMEFYDQADVGVLAAARAWLDSGARYALMKYRFSLERDWFTPHSADPRHRDIFAYKYEDPRSQVSAAFSIVAAYSVLEELGLEVRSSAQKPRFRKSAPGVWNPDVLDDINRRLSAAGIPPDTTVNWLRRGARTKVEKEISPRLGVPAEWCQRYGVRDQELVIADALHYVSWLRNFVAAHKFRALASEVSPYDVHNAQMVARRVILGYLGLWDYLFTRVSA